MNIKNKFTFGLLAFFSILCFKSQAQQGATITTSDLELWTGAELNYQATDKLSLGLEQQLRLRNNASEVDQYFTEFNLKKEVNKSFYYSLGFRYIRDNDQQGDIQAYENNFRYNLDLGYKQNINKLKLNYRLRYQRRNELGISIAEGDEPRNYMRLKVGADYKIKNWKLDPSFSTELFYNMNQGEGFDKFRLTLGTKYKIKKVGALLPFYRLERELGATYPKNTYILGFKFIYNIKRKNKNEQ